MLDDVTRSALARGKPISAARATQLVEALARLEAGNAAARAAADQAISNLRAIVSLNDDPYIDEIARETADLLGEILEPTHA